MVIHESFQQPLKCILEKNNDIHPAAHTHNNTCIPRSFLFFPLPLSLSHTPHTCEAKHGCLSDENYTNVSVGAGEYNAPGTSFTSRMFEGVCLCFTAPHNLRHCRISSTLTLQHPRLALSSLWAAGWIALNVQTPQFHPLFAKG